MDCCSVTHDVGAVAGLRSIKDAAAVARAVLMYTKHTLLTGELGNHRFLTPLKLAL